MGYCKRTLHKLLFPGLAVVIASIPVAAALLSYTFLFGEEDGPIAYFSYAISAYSLAIVCAQAVKLLKGTCKALLYRNKYLHRYLTEVPFKIWVSLYLSLGINLLYAVAKLFGGAYYRSVWFGTLAVYYMLLAIMRFLLLRHVNRTTFGKDLVSELKQYRLCGVILMLMNIVLSGVVLLVVRENESFAYAGHLIYIMALYAFYNIITAAMDMITYRKYRSPVMSAAKSIKLATALVSMLSLETAMLAQFGSENAPQFRQLMTGITGGCVCLIILAMAVFMIATSTKQLRHQAQDP